MFTQAVSVGGFAERYDMDRNNPAEIADARDRKNPIEIATLSEKCSFPEKIVYVYRLLILVKFSNCNRN